MSVEWLQYLPAPLRRGFYFGLQRAIGSRIGPVWKEFQSWKALSPEELDRRVDSRLSAVLDAAIRQSAFYRSLGLKRSPSEPAAHFLRRFPVLKRKTIRERFCDLVADPYRGEIASSNSVSKRRYDWVVVRTGGTTGEPTTVVHGADARDWGRASRLHSASQCGMALGTRYFRLWGSEEDLRRVRLSLPRQAQQALLGCVPMNAFRSRPSDLRGFYELIRTNPRIVHMEAYVDAAVSLALFIREQALPRLSLRSVIATAGTVTPEWRDILQEVFGGEVFDKYGSRECCDIACECSAHSGLHVMAPSVFIEIVDDQDNQTKPGQVGKILVTLLNNPVFPMIRYEIGDLAEWAEPTSCPCGLAWPRLKSLQGRADDVLLTEDGTWLTSVFVRHFVGVSLNRQLIREWQLEQNGPKSLVFRYIPLSLDGLEENLTELRQCFRSALGQGVSIATEQVQEIPKTATGKVRWIVNSWQQLR